MSVRPQKLEFWIEKRYNALFIGKHGVGKSTIVIEAFNKAGLRWAYFSGATMDPFIDFVGVPVKIGEPGKEVIELIRPRHIAEGDIQAIFVDELNRTHKKVRNALMELIQFKTINGKAISSDLRIVWAAINPEGDSEDTNVYDVDKLDPAQRDRFQIQCDIPYKPHMPYFSEKYGPERATAAIEYWHALPDETKELVSPRRLDYALKVYADGGDIRDVLPTQANSSKLVDVLQNGTIKAQLATLLAKTHDEIRSFFQKENNYARVIAPILKDKKHRETFIPFFPPEKIMTLLVGANKNIVRPLIEQDLKDKKQNSSFVPILQEGMKAKQSKSAATLCKALLATYSLLPPKQPKAGNAAPDLTSTSRGNRYRPGSKGHGVLAALAARNMRAKELEFIFGSITAAAILSDMKQEGLVAKTGGLMSPYEITALGKMFLSTRGPYTVKHYKQSINWPSPELPWDDQKTPLEKVLGL